MKYSEHSTLMPSHVTKMTLDVRAAHALWSLQCLYENLADDRVIVDSTHSR